jgi:hypothetical protein
MKKLLYAATGLALSWSAANAQGLDNLSAAFGHPSYQPRYGLSGFSVEIEPGVWANYGAIPQRPPVWRDVYGETCNPNFSMRCYAR